MKLSLRSEENYLPGTWLIFLLTWQGWNDKTERRERSSERPGLRRKHQITNSGLCCGRTGICGPFSPDQSLTLWWFLLSDPHCTDCCSPQVLDNACLSPAANLPWLHSPGCSYFIQSLLPASKRIKNNQGPPGAPRPAPSSSPNLNTEARAEISGHTEAFLFWWVPAACVTVTAFTLSILTCSEQPGLRKRLPSARTFPLDPNHCLPRSSMHALKFIARFLQCPGGAENDSKGSLASGRGPSRPEGLRRAKGPEPTGAWPALAD